MLGNDRRRADRRVSVKRIYLKGVKKKILRGENLAKFFFVCYTDYMINLTKFSGKKICVAVSGGVDSMALLHYLSAQQAEGGYRLAVAHCEHGIRG